MLTRSPYPKQKQVLVINDVPVAAEIANGEKFTAVSNMNLLTSLRTGRVNVFSNKIEGFLGIKASEIATTYVSYEGFGEDNFDWKNDFRKRKDLEHSQENDSYVDKVSGETFYKLENQKDTFVSSDLWQSLQALMREIQVVNPKLVIVTGKWALFFLTGCTSLTSNMAKGADRKPLGGLNKFRASIMQASPCWNLHEFVLFPMFHTIHAIAMPDKVYVMEMDLERVGWINNTIKEYGVEYYRDNGITTILGTSLTVVEEYFNELLVQLETNIVYTSIDIETMHNGIIDCIGFAYETDRGICIPFAHRGNVSYWSVEDESSILKLLQEVLLHRNIRHVGQNYAYDLQYLAKLWLIPLRVHEDTMVLAHTLFNYLPKDLAFLASLFVEKYCYWKDEITASEETPETRWIYNIKDCCYTLEVLQGQQQVLAATGDKELEALYRFLIDDLHPELIETMNDGMAIDLEQKESLHEFFSAIINVVPAELNKLLGFPFNANSAQQKKKLFTEFFGMPLKTKKKKGGGVVETCDAKAMFEYIDEYPLFAPFLRCLVEFSALGKFNSTFLGMKLDKDGRARTQYKITGTKFGRLASTKNVWGNGANWQNLPEKGKVPIKTLLDLVSIANAEEDDKEALGEFIREDFVELEILEEELA